MKALELTGADPEELFPNAERKPLDYSNWHPEAQPATIA